MHGFLLLSRPLQHTGRQQACSAAKLKADEQAAYFGIVEAITQTSGNCRASGGHCGRRIHSCETAMQQQASMKAPAAQTAVAARCTYAVAGKCRAPPRTSEAAAVQQKAGDVDIIMVVAYNRSSAQDISAIVAAFPAT